jgi:hypothetical protein
MFYLVHRTPFIRFLYRSLPAAVFVLLFLRGLQYVTNGFSPARKQLTLGFKEAEE